MNRTQLCSQLSPQLKADLFLHFTKTIVFILLEIGRIILFKPDTQLKTKALAGLTSIFEPSMAQEAFIIWCIALGHCTHKNGNTWYLHKINKHTREKCAFWSRNLCKFSPKYFHIIAMAYLLRMSNIVIFTQNLVSMTWHTVTVDSDIVVRCCHAKLLVRWMLHRWVTQLNGNVRDVSYILCGLDNLKNNSHIAQFCLTAFLCSNNCDALIILY